MRVWPVTLVVVSLFFTARLASGEQQLKPYLGLMFGGSTTYNDPDLVSGKVHSTIGISAVALGEILGVEADLSYAGGFFQKGSDSKVRSSNVTTLTGNVVVAFPRHLTEYTLRPYVVGGAGWMHVQSRPFNIQPLAVSDNAPSLDFGGGVTGFVSNNVGVSWDVRHFRTMGGKDEIQASTDGRLSFWRANMALAIRF